MSSMCRLCGGGSPHVRRPREVAALRELPRRRSARRGGGLLSAARAHLRGVPPRPARGVRRRRGDLHATTPTSRRTRTRWVAHARAYTEMITERLGLGADEPRRRAGLERRLPAPALRRNEAFPSLGIDPAANVAEAARASAASTTIVDFFGSRLRRTTRRRRTPRRPGRREQRARAGSRAERLRRGHRDRARAARRGDDRGAASRPADRGAPVRHDLPRALLVLLADDARPSSSPATASSCSTSRSCASHGGSLRVYAAARWTTMPHPVGAVASPSCSRASAREGLRRPRGVRATSPSAWTRPSGACSSS